jgi:hypothetical protein
MRIEKITTQGWNRLLRAIWNQAKKDLSCNRGKPNEYCYYKTCHDCKEWAQHWTLTAVKTGIKGYGWLHPKYDNISSEEKIDGKI